MKLKFKAEPQDVLIFAIFAVFLLYVVCLGVVNLPYLASTGKFYGLNPIPAFTENLGVTLLFYFLILGVIFFSISSYFFELDSGFGFGKKGGKGYSDWSSERDIKRDDGIKEIHPGDPKFEYGGMPLILKQNKAWVDNGEYHTMVIGATGSGKTQCVVFPTVNILARKGESMIITDPKGEIYEKTSNMLRALGYQILLLNFRDPQRGSSWNPMSLPYKFYKEGNQDKAIELLDDLAANILYEEKSGNADPFWEKTSADYFSGLALGLFEDANEDEININSISLMSTVGEDKIGRSTYIKEYFNMKDPASAASVNASSTIMAPDDTKGSILSVFKQKIKLFASRENLSEMLSHSDIDITTIGKQKTVLFIVIQDEKKTYHSLVTILLKQCYETLISVAQENGGKLPVRTNFLLDEFANMPPLKDITTMITAARSRQIRFLMIIQNFAQLDEVYGKENAETLKGNCGNIIYLITTELKALEEISKMCGEKESKKSDKTASTPLVTVSDLQRMKLFDCIILRLRQQPFKTSLTPDFKMEWGEHYPKADYPEREKEGLKTFDLKGFVQAKKGMSDPGMMGSPFGSMGGGMGGGMSRPDLASMLNPMSEPPREERPAPRKPADNSDFLQRLDAHLKELEEKDRLEEEKNKAEKSVFEHNDELKPKSNVVEDEVKPEPVKEEIKPEPVKEGKNDVIKHVDENEIQMVELEPSDDTFFDDFFDSDFE